MAKPKATAGTWRSTCSAAGTLSERRPQRPYEGRARCGRRASGKITYHIGRDVDAHDELALERDSFALALAGGEPTQRCSVA